MYCLRFVIVVYNNYIFYQSIYMSISSELFASITSPSFVVLVSDF